MSVQARVNHLFGGADAPVTVSPVAVGSNNLINIPAVGSWINLTASAVTTLGGTGTSPLVPVFAMPAFSRNRLLFLYNNGSQDIIFTNNDNTTTNGYMDLGGSNVTLGATDLLCVYVRADGSAVRVFNTNN